MAARSKSDKKRARVESADGEEDMVMPKGNAIKKQQSVAELTLRDLFSVEEMDAMKEVYNAKRVSIRNRMIARAKEAWSLFLKYDEMCFKEFDRLFKMQDQEYDQAFTITVPPPNYRNLPIVHSCLQRIHESIRFALDVPLRAVEHVVYRAMRGNPCTLDELVDSCIIVFTQRSMFDGNWAVEPFLEKCYSFVKGNGKTNYCKGLVAFLRNHLEWQLDADCEAWITKLENVISREALKDSKNPMIIKSMLRNAFDMRDYQFASDVPARPRIFIPSTSPNLGRYIRL